MCERETKYYGNKTGWDGEVMGCIVCLGYGWLVGGSWGWICWFTSLRDQRPGRSSWWVVFLTLWILDEGWLAERGP